MVVTRTRASKSYARSAEIQLLPRLIEVQLQSFKLFQNELLRELFEEISPIESFNGEARIRIHGEIWSARSATALQQGQQVRVTDLEGLTLLVKPLNQGHTESQSKES